MSASYAGDGARTKLLGIMAWSLEAMGPSVWEFERAFLAFTRRRPIL